MLGSARRRLATTFSLGGWLPVVHRASGRGRRVALTFDDGPTPETTPALLALLRQAGAQAAFFICGERAAAHPDLVAAIVADGHPVYAHGYAHVRLDRLSEAAALQEIARTEVLLCRFRPTPSPSLVRMPYGSGHRDVRMHRLMRRWHPDCRIAHWRYNFEDFRLAEDCDSPDELAARCRAAVRTALASRHFIGSAVLLHECPIGAGGRFVGRIAELLIDDLLAAMAQEGIAPASLDLSLPRSPIHRCIRTVAMA